MNNTKDRIINQLVGLIDHSDTSGRAEWCQGWLREDLIRQGFWVPNQPVKPGFVPTYRIEPSFTGYICKGSKQLNSHCGTCERCKYHGYTK